MVHETCHMCDPQCTMTFFCSDIQAVTQTAARFGILHCVYFHCLMTLGRTAVLLPDLTIIGDYYYYYCYYYSQI